MTSVQFAHTKEFYLYSALYDNEIAYIRFPSFSIGENIGDYATGIGVALENYYSLVESNKVKGIIIDLRCNNGGYLVDMGLLTKCLVSKDDYFPFAYTRQKSGLGRLDYSPYVEMAVPATSDNPTRSDLPIVILTDRFSISMGEITPLAFKQISDKVKIVGERTFGATSPLTEHFILGGGIHKDFNLHQASVALVSLDKKSIEGYGVEPDIESPLAEFEMVNIDGIDYTRFKDATDNQFNKAVQCIKSM